jgi:tRNA(Ile)-lysidine synthase TilS/MesJ
VNRCTRCILPETFPGIRFDADGVCQYCRRMPSAEQQAARRARLCDQFEELVEQTRSRPGYHCMMSWSGGKDSTYTLWNLKQRYDLRVLAFTFDNGFVSPGALKNMRVVAENLQVDHVIVKPRFELLRQVFLAAMRPGVYSTRALERASGICTSCMALAKGIALRLALREQIPMLVYGWSPGQIPLASALFRFNRRMLEAFMATAMAPLREVVGEEIDVYFPEERDLEQVESVTNVSPLAFLPADEETALSSIRPLGWRRPEDTDPNSTNCLLNGFASRVHIEQMGFHPYAMELAGLVREGYMAREEALSRLEIEVAPEIEAAVETKLGLSAAERRDRLE